MKNNEYMDQLEDRLAAAYESLTDEQGSVVDFLAELWDVFIHERLELFEALEELEEQDKRINEYRDRIEEIRTRYMPLADALEDFLWNPMRQQNRKE